MKQLWIRAGMMLGVTDEEAKIILSEDSDSADIAEVVTNIILEKRFAFNGDSYVPQCCVERFNEKYNTRYEADDIGFELDIQKEEVN